MYNVLLVEQDGSNIKQSRISFFRMSELPILRFDLKAQFNWINSFPRFEAEISAVAICCLAKRKSDKEIRVEP